MRTVVNNARRAQLQGKKVPASERVFSIFEPHVELIRWGKRQKPVEFGHKILLCQTREKFITDYAVYEKQEADCELTEPVIQRHEKLFGTRPEVLATDKGFCPAEAKFKELAEQVETLAIPRRHAGLHGQGVGVLAGVPGGDRGDYFRSETRISADSLFLSRV